VSSRAFMQKGGGESRKINDATRKDPPIVPCRGTATTSVTQEMESSSRRGYKKKVCDEIVTEGAAVTARRTPLDHQEEGVGRLSPPPFFPRRSFKKNTARKTPRPTEPRQGKRQAFTPCKIKAEHVYFKKNNRVTKY